MTTQDAYTAAAVQETSEGAPAGRRGWLSRHRAAAALITAPLLLAGCQIPSFGAYHGATPQAQDSFKLWQGFFVAGLAVGGIVAVLILWAVFRYRRRTDAIPRQTQYHTVIEIIYTLVPILIVAVLFAFTVITENKVDATPPATVDIKVTAFQWGWQFYYPQTGKVVEGVTTQAPQMEVPAGESVAIDLVSADVVHGFYVPQFNFSRYALPGVDNHFNFTVLHDGVYRGQCTQLCGLYHSIMFFSVKAVPPAQFTVWEHQVPSGAGASINKLKSEITAKGPGS